jgi:hypothetical protein
MLGDEHISIRSLPTGTIMINAGPANGMACCPGCGSMAPVLRCELLCLVCSGVYVPDRCVQASGPYHDGTAWERVDGRSLRGGGFA